MRSTRPLWSQDINGELLARFNRLHGTGRTYSHFPAWCAALERSARANVGAIAWDRSSLSERTALALAECDRQAFLNTHVGATRGETWPAKTSCSSFTR
jgi:hypothetical protein